MAINEIWRPRGSWEDIVRPYTLLEAGYLVNDLNPRSPNEDQPAEVIKAIRDMKRDLENNPRENWFTYRSLGTISISDEIGPDNIYVNSVFIKKWAHHYGITDFFGELPDLSLTESERDILLKQIGLLSLVLAERVNKYKKGSGAPNVYQIANAAGEIVEASEFEGKRGTGSTSIRENIARGLKLLINPKD
jgi:hypothetical protein